VIVMAAMAMDDSSRAEPGWLWQKGRLVRRTSMTASSVMAGSMNQPLRDRVALAGIPGGG
jgi:hypothetical protein